jgi:hypothetical protein
MVKVFKYLGPFLPRRTMACKLSAHSFGRPTPPGLESDRSFGARMPHHMLPPLSTRK